MMATLHQLWWANPARTIPMIGALSLPERSLSDPDMTLLKNRVQYWFDLVAICDLEPGVVINENAVHSIRRSIEHSGGNQVLHHHYQHN